MNPSLAAVGGSAVRDVRSANPADLEQLADLLDHQDGGTGVVAELQRLFVRASDLGARDLLRPLDPLQSWASETAADLRTRACLLRGWTTAGDIYGVYEDASVPLGAAYYGLRGLLAWRPGSPLSAPLGMGPTYLAHYGSTGRVPSRWAARRATFGVNQQTARLLGGDNRLARRIYRAGALGNMRNAQQVSLLRLGSFQYSTARTAGAHRLASFVSALSETSRVAGFIRGAGIVGSAYSVLSGTAGLLARGSPEEAFAQDASGYMTEVTSVAFQSALTAALLAPNPFTVGATVGMGVAHGIAVVWNERERLTDPQTYARVGEAAWSVVTDPVTAVTVAGEAVVGAAEDAALSVLDAVEDLL